MVVYELLHTYYVYGNSICYSLKRLGFYSDKSKLEEAISFFRCLPGFCDAPNGFVAKQREVYGVNPAEEFYEACIYAHTLDFEDYEYTVEIGLFGDITLAENAIEHFCANNALFLNNPALEIERLVEKYTINNNAGWIDGFAVEPIP